MSWNQARLDFDYAVLEFVNIDCAGATTARAPMCDQSRQDLDPIIRRYLRNAGCCALG